MWDYRRCVVAVVLGCLLFIGNQAWSQEATDQPAASDPELSSEQLATTARYERFEKSLLQLFEYMRKTDPDRADLLERAYRQSREDQISSQMRSLVKLLEQEEYGDAVVQQEELMTHLGSLLNLLQSEDRMSELEKEKARIEALIKDVNRAIGKEKVVRADTERNGDPEKIAGKQQDVADETQGIVDKMKAQDGESQAGKPSSGNPSESQPGDSNSDQDPSEGDDPKDNEPGENEPGEPSEQEPGDEPSEGSPSESQGQPQSGEPQSGEPQSGQPQSGEPQSGQPSESQPGEPSEQQQPGQQGEQQSQESSGNTPGREELEQAKREMEKAIEELKKKNAKDASKHQDKALEELIAAKEKLEEILQQLREEERRLILAALEARFQKMLNMQVVVLNGTINLSKTPERERKGSRFTGRAVELARMEDEIALEADKALVILKAEGTSVAFPIAVEDMLTDINTVSRRLEDVKVDELTEAIERDIIEALQEMVEALQKEMEKDSKSQESPPSNNEGESVLVDKLAELKMLRTLQKRVNRRTRTLGRLIDGEQADDPDVLTQLQELSQRQARIVRTAYEINNTLTDP